MTSITGELEKQLVLNRIGDLVDEFNNQVAQQQMIISSILQSLQDLIDLHQSNLNDTP